MIKELQQAKLKQGYFIALIILIAASTLSSVVAVNLIIDQEHDSRNINISGMQRMLSQKIALHAEQIKGQDPAQVDYARKRMLASAIRFLENHKLLTDAQTNPSLPSAIEQKYFLGPEPLDKKFRAFAADALAFSDAANYHLDWQYSNQQIERILLELDELVTLFEQDASENVAMLFFIELAIWLINLIIIFVAYWVLAKRSHLGDQ